MDEARSRNKKLHELVEKTFSVALRYAQACGSQEVLFFNTLAARVKSCPDTKQPRGRLFPQALLLP